MNADADLDILDRLVKLDRDLRATRYKDACVVYLACVEIKRLRRENANLLAQILEDK